MFDVSSFVVSAGKKEKIGVYLSPALLEAFYAASGSSGRHDKRKSLAHAAAILLFIDAPERVRHEVMQRLNNVGIGGATLEEIVEQARIGRLRPNGATPPSQSPELAALTDGEVRELDGSLKVVKDEVLVGPPAPKRRRKPRR